MNKGEEILNICWDTFQKKMCLESFFLKQNLKEYKPSEIHCIQYVGDNPNVNVTKLADAFNMTTGGVTKLTKRLIGKKLLSTHKSLDNKKEIYFTLSDKGKEIYNISLEKSHEKAQSSFNKEGFGFFAASAAFK